MGIGERSIMSKTLALLLLAFLVGSFAAEEVQELGNTNTDAMKDTSMTAEAEAHDDDMGEDVGRRGGFLPTTGSFTLSSGGNRAGNDEEDELGEDDGVGRRGGFLSTTGSFTLSSGGNRAGNDEEDEI